MKRVFPRVALAAVAASAIALGTIHHASAHAVVQTGKLTVAIGWLHEPAYVGFDNAVQVLVKDAQGNPVDVITDKDLQVEVSLDAQKLSAQPLVPTFDSDTGLGLHGEYEFHLIPTAPGNYTFHVFGKIAGTTQIDETITASDKTFNAVQDQNAAEFPGKVPAASEVGRKVDAVGTRVDTARLAAANANDAANRAMVVGIVALILGVVIGGAGVVTGLRASRRRV